MTLQNSIQIGDGWNHIYRLLQVFMVQGKIMLCNNHVSIKWIRLWSKHFTRLHGSHLWIKITTILKILRLLELWNSMFLLIFSWLYDSFTNYKTLRFSNSQSITQTFVTIFITLSMLWTMGTFSKLFPKKLAGSSKYRNKK